MKRKPATSKTQSNGAITIEKGFPIPPPRNHYPMDKMKVGDSFLLPNGTFTRAGLHTVAKRFGIVITVRKTDQGYRVWRIA